MSRLLLNADIGERGATHVDDVALMELLDIANIACGGHAGDPTSMAAFTALAQARGVQVAAHLAYPDRIDFGRRSLQLPWKALRETLDQQWRGLAACRRVKFHGALYNDAHVQPELAHSLATWAAECGVDEVLAMPDSALAQALQVQGIKTLREAFLERRYMRLISGQLVLVPRNQPHASITVLEEALDQAYHLIHGARVRVYPSPSDAPHWADLDVDTLCVHSDSPIALALARGVRGLLRP